MKPVKARPSARLAVVLALLLAAPTAVLAVYDGYLASPDRSGIVRLNTYANGSYVDRCSGAIVSSSRARNETWILTAAHCWSELSWRYQQRRLPEPYRAFVPGSG